MSAKGVVFYMTGSDMRYDKLEIQPKKSGYTRKLNPMVSKLNIF